MSNKTQLPNLLRTNDVFEPEVIKEEVEGPSGKKERKLLMKGVLQKADVLNQNGRIYPFDILSREIRNYQKFISENRSLGELDHPDQSVVSLKNASHIIREAHIDDDGVVYGTIEVLNTPAGKILQSLVDSQVKIGISSRGVGSVQKQGDYHVVQDDFQLVTWDVVSEPSTSGAFVIPEGRQVTSEELRRVFNRSDRIARIMNDILDI